jgi:hypothetical protein
LAQYVVIIKQLKQKNCYWRDNTCLPSVGKHNFERQPLNRMGWDEIMWGNYNKSHYSTNGR